MRTSLEEFYVDYAAALNAKKFGFDEPCDAHYSKPNKLTKLSGGTAGTKYSQLMQSPVLAPYRDVLITWFREKHDIDITYYRITPFEGPKVFIITIINFKTFINRHDTIYVNHGIPDKPINHWEDLNEGLKVAFEQAFKLI